MNPFKRIRKAEPTSCDILFKKGHEFNLWGNLVATASCDICVNDIATTDMLRFEPGWGDTDADRRATFMLVFAGRVAGIGSFK